MEVPFSGLSGAQLSGSPVTCCHRTPWHLVNKGAEEGCEPEPEAKDLGRELVCLLAIITVNPTSYHALHFSEELLDKSKGGFLRQGFPVQTRLASN